MLSAAQLAMRKSGVGGSEVAAVVGWNPWRTKMDVWEDKVNDVTATANSAMKAGTFFEDGVAAMYSSEHGVQLRRCLRTLRHPVYPWALATPDRFVLAGRRKGRLCEIKVPGRRTPEWGAAGTDEIPRYYMSQVQWTMEVTGLKACDVVVYFLASRELVVYHVVYNVGVVEYLFDEVQEFWTKHVVPRIPPALDGGDGTKRYLDRVYPADASRETAPAPPSAEKWAQQYLQARSTEAATKQLKDEASSMLKAMIGEHAGLRAPGWCATWKLNHAGHVDWQAAAVHMEVKIAEATAELEKLAATGADAAAVKQVLARLAEARDAKNQFKTPGVRQFNLHTEE